MKEKTIFQTVQVQLPDECRFHAWTRDLVPIIQIEIESFSIGVV